MDASPIMVVEDDDLVRSFLSRALTGIAGDVVAVARGAEALVLVEQRPFGVILLDGLLPDIHGVELARKLVNHRNATKTGICFVSGSLRHPSSMRDGISALPKPLRLHELLVPVKELLAWSRGPGASTAARLAALDTIAAGLLVA